jgi:hypothetical protein
MAPIIGTPGEDDLSSAVAGDVILGLGGDDVLAANAANITLDGGSGDDQLFSFTDGATLIGGPGNDFLSGLGTNDTASYANDPAGVVVDLSSADADGIVYVIDGTGGTDTLLGIENVTGSASGDSLTGDDGANVLQGGAGNDTLTGNGGNDIFKYSFDFTQGGGETFSFTEFFAEHGGRVINGEVADGTSQGQFSSLYTQWLQSLGLNVLDLGQNSGPDGMPVVEGPDGTFGERESFTWTSGSATKTVTHERWYSDTWSTGDGQDAVTSGDGFDTIVDFGNGADKLQFDFSADSNWADGQADPLAYLESFFNIDRADFTSDGLRDTRLSVDMNDDGNTEWSVLLESNDLTDAQVFAALDIYVNDLLIG